MDSHAEQIWHCILYKLKGKAIREKTKEDLFIPLTFKSTYNKEVEYEYIIT